ncbi:hypothetical protein DK847_05465 [Aestuariivirga litoralis]|uniref:Uncharacterized protein n=1 Tax=Aestuariivirga litoralis TaxID=2650924 RepID=A0A2W2BWQ7_9HYPH|nr:hypothetical protein [Aestuariivirga litoralis]PZF77876.1 hypothetical protein DK847_05465 [Aestuariivirga litoralis]
MTVAPRLALAVLATLLAGTAAQSQEQGDEVSTFSRIKGGAVYDYKYGVDGSAVSEEYELIHVVCSDGSKSLRVMLPVSPEADGDVSDSNGPASTLVKTGAGYQVTFRANGRNIRKSLEVKPVNDPKSNLAEQFVVRLDYGDRLWKALTSEKDGAAVMLIGQGGRTVNVPVDNKLTAALSSCGLGG